MLAFCASVSGRCSSTADSRSFWRNRSIASSYAVCGPSPDIARASIALGARGAVSLVTFAPPCSARFAHSFVYNLVTRGRHIASRANAAPAAARASQRPDRERSDTMGIKLSAKFARQETEAARLARIARKRIPTDRIATIRRMLGVPEPERQILERRSHRTDALACPECHRVFALPMHLGRHKRAKHRPMDAA